MFEKMTWLDVLLVPCIVGFVGFSLWFVDLVKAYRRYVIAEKLIERAKKQIADGGNRSCVLSGMAYMAKEQGVGKEINELWPELDK